MKNRRAYHAFLLLALPLLCLAAYAQPTAAQPAPEPQAINQNGPTIKDTYKGQFLIGTAGDVPGGFTPQELTLIRDNFNIITPENYFKPAAVHPAEKVWAFDRTDALVQWCVDNHVAIHGHTLSWHGQTNPWFFEGGDKATITKRLQDHITTLLTRYKGKIHSWDVVNEAIDGNAPNSENLRNSQWVQNIGPEFLTIAFKAAHAADPDALLFYNDYGIEVGGKHDSSMRLLKRLIAEGAPINGVGIQGHWSANGLPYDALDKAITDYASLGLKVAISELDIAAPAAPAGQPNPGGGRRGGPGAGPATAPGGTPATNPAGRGRGRGGPGVLAAPQPTVLNTADSIRTVVTDLSADQTAKIAAITQDLAPKIAQWQTSSSEALLVAQPQYSAGQLAYEYETAHLAAVQFQQNAIRDGLLNDAEIAMVAVLTPDQATKWENARLKEEASSRFAALGLSDSQNAKIVTIAASQTPKVLNARDKDTLLAAKADFWKEALAILTDAQTTALLSPAPDAVAGRGRTAATPSAQALKAQADAYAKLFAVLEKHKADIDRVTFWGLNDRRSWRSGESPLLFDVNNQRKPAYDAVVKALTPQP